MQDARFEPETTASVVWSATNEQPHLQGHILAYTCGYEIMNYKQESGQAYALDEIDLKVRQSSARIHKHLTASCTLGTAPIGWSDLNFFDFRKWTHCCRLSIFFPKIGMIFTKSHTP